MNEMDGLMERMSEALGKLDKARILGGEELVQYQKSFIPIEGLKAGDKVRWKPGLKDCKFPDESEIVEVFRVFSPKATNHDGGSNHFMDQADFSLMVSHHEEIFESAFDSRRFERVE